MGVKTLRIILPLLFVFDCENWMWCAVCCFCLVVIVCSFPQRVDEPLDVPGEDSFQAKEAVPGDTAEEGKPSSKT